MAAAVRARTSAVLKEALSTEQNTVQRRNPLKGRDLAPRARLRRKGDRGAEKHGPEERVTPGHQTKRAPILLSREEQQLLILAHLESAGKFAWALLNRWRISLPLDEVQSIAGASLCEAASRFDTSLGVNFKTFFFYHLRGLLLREITRRVSDHRLRVSADQTEMLTNFEEQGGRDRAWPSAFVNHNTPESLIADEQVRRVLQNACAALDPVSREIVNRCFVNGDTVSAIARDLGYCRCHVSRMKTKALRFLQESLQESLGFEQARGLFRDDEPAAA